MIRFLFTLLPSILFYYGYAVSSIDTIQPVLKDISFKVTVNSPASLSKGYLASIDDSIICFSKIPIKFGEAGTGDAPTSSTIPYEKISSMIVSRKGAVGRSALTGGLSLMLVGVIAGFASGDDDKENFIRFSAGTKALGLGVTGLVMGGVVGAIIGAVSNKKYIINGNRKNFKNMHQEILSKAYEMPKIKQ